MNDEREVKPHQDAEAAHVESPRSDAVGPVSTRRQLLKGLTTGTVAIGALSQAGCELVIPALNPRGATETTAVCPFCGVGCGQVVSSRDGTVINIEGGAVTRS